MYSNNPISKSLFVFGIVIMVLGVISGFMLAMESYEFLWGIFFIYILSGVASGLVFMGLSEIISELSGLNRNFTRLDYKISSINNKINNESKNK